MFFLTIRLESREPCQTEVQKRLQMKALRWQSRDHAWWRVPAKARPINLVMRSPRSEEDSSQSLGYLVIPENADERKEVEIAGHSWRSASRSEIGYSQASRQENAPMATGNTWREDQLRKQSDQREYSNSNCTKKPVLGASKPEFQKMSEPSIHDQDLSVPAKEVGKILNFSRCKHTKQKC